MMSKKLHLIIGILITVILTVSMSSMAIYNNYNSNNINGWTPGNNIDAYNQYQIDGEGADILGGGAVLANNGNMQAWGNPALWPYGVTPVNAFNCIHLPPGGTAQWTL